MEARMDGTLEQKLLWRVSALREALRDVTTMTEPQEAACIVAKNALSVDDMNAKQCFPRRIPETEDEANEAADNGRNTGGKSYR